MSDDELDRLREALADRYALEGEIDRGGMAVVYLAEDLKHGRKVAIKVLSENLSASLGTERFTREIEVIARLQHPNILTLIDSGEADGLRYYVMPFVEGLSLKARLERDGALPIDEAVRIGAEIADALGAAHERGVIHRDMKPGNVLLSGGHAIVADFGIAGAIDEAKEGRITATGVSLGSPAYMSPEQASGEREIDLRTDVYGLGCILYEMLCGEAPFEGSVMTLLTKKALGTTQALEERRPDVPSGVLAAVSKAMAVDPDDRFDSAHDLKDALLGGLPQAEPAGLGRRRTMIAAAAVAGVVLIAAVAVQRTRAAGAQALWASQQLAEVERLVEAGQFPEALEVAREVEAVFPADTTLARLYPRFTFTTSINSDPAGARVYLQAMDGPEDEWQDLGVTPIDEVRFAGLTFEFPGWGINHEAERPVRVRFELDGHRERDVLLTAILGMPWRGRPAMNPIELTREDPSLEGMVRIPGFTRDGIEYADYYMDRFEVTNAQFKEFVDADGYTDAQYWTHGFVTEDGSAVTFEQAMALFKDQTGRDGPSTWRLGTYPEGTAEHPVGGVSWHEAAAYARWAGKELPSTTQWTRGRHYYRENSHVIVPRSNLGTDGPRPVGQNRGMTTLGVYDLVGNVREWCYNEVGEGQRATRGAAWPDAPFHVSWIIPKGALDRSETHGIRLIKTFDSPEALAALREPVAATAARDYFAEQPASEAEFNAFRSWYEYAPLPLNPEILAVDSAEHWVRELVAFDLPYGERGGAALYLPRGFQGPLQAVVYWGGANLMATKSIDEEWEPAFDYIVRSGRAVVVPLFAGAYGRLDPRPAATVGRILPRGRDDLSYRDMTVQWVKDFRTSIDYLETRDDIDPDALAYFGFSFGGFTAPIVLSVEPRLKAAALNVGGLFDAYPLPEVDPFNFLPRVQTPLLMVNGEHDIVFPYETGQRPFYERLGTPAEDKRHHLASSAHFVPIDELIREVLDWYDKYLGLPAGT